MKLLLLRLLLGFIISIPLYSFESTTPQTLALLEQIDHEAMIYGNGPKTVYLFIDPNCPNSQDFLSLIFESTKMKEMYQYHIFLYELKRLNSSSIIKSIYMATSPLQTTFEYMIGHKTLSASPPVSNKIIAKIRSIETVAEQLNIKKRPYLIISKETK